MPSASGSSGLADHAPPATSAVIVSAGEPVAKAPLKILMVTVPGSAVPENVGWRWLVTVPVAGVAIVTAGTEKSTSNVDLALTPVLPAAST